MMVGSSFVFRGDVNFLGVLSWERSHIPPLKKKIIFNSVLGRDMLVPRRVLLLPQSRLVENGCISNMIFLSNFVGNFPLNHDCGSFRVDTRTFRPHVPTVNSKGSPNQVSFYGEKKQI